MALLVAGAVMADGRGSRSAAGDHRHGPGATDHAPQSVGVVAFVGQDVPCPDGAFEKPGAALTSATLPGVSVIA